MKCHRAVPWLAACLVVVVGLVIIGLGRGRRSSTFTISPATTVVTGPIHPDGTVDYFSVVEAELSGGVTFENNAAVPVLKASGPRLLGTQMLGQALSRLGMKELPDARRFQTFKEHLDEESPDVPAEERKELERTVLTCFRGGRWQASDFPLVAKWLQKNDQALSRQPWSKKRP